jgi:hypothetical protein
MDLPDHLNPLHTSPSNRTRYCHTRYASSRNVLLLVSFGGHRDFRRSAIGTYGYVPLMSSLW